MYWPGAFGSVHLAEWSFRVSCAPVEVAVKCLKDGADEKAEKDFLAEARIMAEFDHPNIIRLFGVVDDGAARIVTEYMSNGNLKDFLEQVRTTDPMLRSRGQLVQYIVDIAGGLQYLATEGFIHRVSQGGVHSQGESALLHVWLRAAACAPLTIF